MKEQLEKLNNLIADGVVDMNDFYAVSVYADKITLQGLFSSSKAMKYGCKEVGKTGYIEGKINCSGTLAEITLT
jgi:hypothetical protein